MRGLKRKFGASEDNTDKIDYKENLTHFQSLARQRESVRLKKQCLIATTPGFWERHLNEKIHVEAEMIKGTAKFLGACKKRDQALEAAKRLQLGRLRHDMLKYELNRLKRGRGSPSNSASSSSKDLAKPSYAGVSLSDIRIPLMWKRKDHLKDSGDNRRFAVFCLARIGAQIYDSALICPIDRSHTDINIEDVFLFNKVSSHFEVTIEVYSKLLKSQSSSSNLAKESAAAAAESFLGKTPQKLVQSISKAVGRKLLMQSSLASSLANDDDIDALTANVGPRFEMIASVTLCLDDCSNDVETHELYVEDANGENSPPMFGGLCCRIAAMPYSCEEPVVAGQVKISGKQLIFKEMYGTLMDWKLSIWNTKEQKDAARKPVYVIPISRDTCILENDDSSVSITNETETWIIQLESSDHKDKWLMCLLQHAADHRRWKIAASKRLPLGALNEIRVSDRGQVQKRPAKYTKSFKRTRSKLFMLYNQAGVENDLLI